MIRLRRIWLQLCRRQHHAQEEPRAELAADKIGMLALPAEASLVRQRLFHQRRGIDKNFHLRAALCHEFAGELLQALLQRVVIVPPPCVDGYVAHRLVLQRLKRIMIRPIIQRDDNR